MSPRERRVQTLAWLLVAGLVAVVLSRSVVRPGPELSSKCTRIADASLWRRDYAGYFWQSNSAIIFGREENDALCRLDLTTHDITTLGPLTTHLSHARPNDTTWRLSPDGRWLLAKQMAPRYRVDAYSVDGSQTVSWPISPNSSPYIHWLPSSREWVELRARPHNVFLPIIHSLDGGGRAAPKIEGPCSFPIGVDSEDELVSSEDDGPVVDVVKYSLRRSPKPVRSGSVHLSIGQRGYEAEASHKGDRIAFLTHSHVRADGLGILGRLFRAFHDSGDRTAIWVANADGSGLHRVGEERDRPIAALQWTPDDSKLSFFIGTSLYTTPAK